MTHELKLLPQYYEEVLNGNKTFETYYTGRTFICTIKYILRDCPDYGLKKGFVILGIS